MNKVIQYREDGKFYGFYKPEEPKIIPDTMEYLMQENKHVKMYVGGDVFGNDRRKAKYEKQFSDNLAAGKEIINPEVLEIGNLLSPFTVWFNKAKPGDIFDCPENIEFEEVTRYIEPEGIHCNRGWDETFIRLKLKREYKTEEENALKLLAALQVKEETQGELWAEAIEIIHGGSTQNWEEFLKSKFTIQRNKNGNE